MISKLFKLCVPNIVFFFFFFIISSFNFTYTLAVRNSFYRISKGNIFRVYKSILSFSKFIGYDNQKVANNFHSRPLNEKQLSLSLSLTRFVIRNSNVFFVGGKYFLVEIVGYKKRI